MQLLVPFSPDASDENQQIKFLVAEKIDIQDHFSVSTVFCFCYELCFFFSLKILLEI